MSKITRAGSALLIATTLLSGCATGGTGSTAASGEMEPGLSSSSNSAVTEKHVVPAGVNASSNVSDGLAILQKGSPVKINNSLKAYDIPVMDFVDEKNGFAVKQAYAESLSLISTSDGGAHWEEKSLPGELVAGLDFIDRQNGWILFQEGCVAKGTTVCKSIRLSRTTDGGDTWTTLWKAASQEDNSRVFSNMRRLSFDNPKNGMMLANGRLYVTRNGGVRFDQVSFGVNHFIPLYISFPSERIGYVVGTVGADAGKLAVLKTTDGARTWRKQLELTGEHSPLSSLGIDFKDERTGWLLTNEEGMLSGELYRTTDGGKDWAKMSTQRTGRPTPTDIRLADANTGVMSLHPGAGPVEGGIWITHDGGKTFASVAPNRVVAVNQVQMLSAKDVWAAADGINESGYILHSADGGTTWKQAYPTVRPTGDVSMIDATRGYAVGTLLDNNAVLQTVDGGTSWNVQGRIGGYLMLEKVSFINRMDGYVMAYGEQEPHRALLKTSDGGKNWAKVSADSLRVLSGVSEPSFFRFYDRKQGIVALKGRGDNIWRTSDGGASWKPSKVGGGGSGTPMYFSSISEGWAVQEGDRQRGPALLRLTGEHPEQKVLSLPEGWYLEAIGFSDSLHGAMIFEDFHTDGDALHLITTSDGGEVWTDHPIPRTSGISGVKSVWFADVKHGWLRFDGGTAETRDGGVNWTILP